MDDEWNLDQALAWVYWRDMSTVEAVAEGAIGDQIAYPPMRYRAIDKQSPPKPWESYGKEFLVAMRTGVLKARARRCNEGDRILMTLEDWRDVLVHTPMRQSASIQPSDPRGKIFWTDLRISSKFLQTVFTADGNDQLLDIRLPLKTRIPAAAEKYLAEVRPAPTGAWRKEAREQIARRLGGQEDQDTIRKFIKETLDKYESAYSGQN